MYYALIFKLYHAQNANQAQGFAKSVAFPKMARAGPFALRYRAFAADTAKSPTGAIAMENDSQTDPSFRPDQLDIALVAELRRAPQITNRDLAQRLAVSESTIGNRIDRMDAADAMRVVMQRDVRALGIEYTALLEMSVSGRPVTTVAGELSKIVEISNLGIVSGPRSLIALVHARTRGDLEALIDDKIGRVRGITGIEGNTVLEMLRFRQEWGILKALPAPSQLFSGCWSMDDETDQAIVQLLTFDGRLSNREVARRLKMSEGGVRQRLRKLTEAGKIRLGVITNPLFFGGLEQSLIGINGPVPRLAALRARLAKSEAVAFAARTLGRWALVVHLVAETRPKLRALINDDLRLDQSGVDYQNLEIVEPAKNRFDLAAI